MKRLGDQGAVTVHAMSIAVLLTIGALVATQMAGLVRLRHQVAAAADLAALAGAQASVMGDDGCAAAGAIAQRNGAVIVKCQMDFDVATITAGATSSSWWGHRWRVNQVARAAPDFYLEDSAE